MEIIPFSRTYFDEKEMMMHVKDKPVFVQGPHKFQILVDELMKSKLPWEFFLGEISKRTGVENPETQFLWVSLAYDCKKKGIKMYLIEPDIDKILNKLLKNAKMSETSKLKVRQEARMWFLSNSGYMKHFYAAFDFLFSWLPFHLFFRKIWLGIVAFFVRIIPGDQKDVMDIVFRAYKEISKNMVKNLKKVRKATVFVEESLADDVERMVLEL